MAGACMAALLAAALGVALPSLAWDAGRLRSAGQALGPRGEVAAREIQALLERSASVAEAARVELVNAHVNRRIAFAEDSLAWQQPDYWASPLEALGKGEGDCEDYAIAKYFLLVATGVPASRLRLVYARVLLAASAGQPERAQAHMVLAYDDDAANDPLILDNLMGDLRRASRRPDLTPVFSFNGEGLWQGTNGASAGDPLQRLSRWRDVVRKARAEGLG